MSESPKKKGHGGSSSNSTTTTPQPSPSKSQPQQQPSSTWSPSLPPRNKLECILPQNRIKLIMKSSPEIGLITSEALFLVTKSVELFIEYLAKKGYANGKGNKSLEYKQIADHVQKDNALEFLRESLPRKITGKEALKEAIKQTSSNNDILSS